MKFRACFIAVVVLSFATFTIAAQSGDHTLYGDLTVDETKVEGVKPLTFDVILYTETGVLIARQPTSVNGRFRFNNLPTGVYQIVIEVESTEVARVNVDLRSPLLKDVRRDIALEWQSAPRSSKSRVVSASDAYDRDAPNQELFVQARRAAKQRKYTKAAELLSRITKEDAKDFEAWAELANVDFLQRNYSDAEKEYLCAIDAHPRFFLALLNLGRLELAVKRYEIAKLALTRAVQVRPESSDANYFLGESYLRLKKGSLAVPYLKEALRLDPDGMAEVHLRLATLYHAAGLQEKAAAEYEAFLKKRPRYADRKKLERYIAEHRIVRT